MKTITVSLVARQQNQQQGNQLAKETDRLIKVFSALPVGADQVLGCLIFRESILWLTKFYLSAAKKDPKRAIAQRLLGGVEHLPEDAAGGGRQRTRVCGPRQSQLQSFGK